MTKRGSFRRRGRRSGQAAAAVERQPGAALDETADAVAEQAGAPPVGEARLRIATEQRDEVGPGGEQRGVDPLLAGDLAHPRRDERHRRAHAAVEVVVVDCGDVDVPAQAVLDRLEDLAAEASPLWRSSTPRAATARSR